MKKSDQNTVNTRVSKVARMLIDGFSTDEIVQYCSVKWQVGERQAYNYIARAREIIEKSVEKNVAYDYSKAIRRYEELYKLAMKKGDIRTAMTINKELSHLQGLQKQQIEHSGNIEFMCSVPD